MIYSYTVQSRVPLALTTAPAAPRRAGSANVAADTDSSILCARHLFSRGAGAVAVTRLESESRAARRLVDALVGALPAGRAPANLLFYG